MPSNFQLYWFWNRLETILKNYFILMNLINVKTTTEIKANSGIRKARSLLYNTTKGKSQNQ